MHTVEAANKQRCVTRRTKIVYFLSNTDGFDDSLEKTIDQYENHPSITCMNKHMKSFELTFTIQPVSKNQISKLINKKNT